MTEPKRKAATIGELNGPWAFMVRFLLATYPFVIAWAVWLTAEQFHDKAFREYGERYTMEMHREHVAEEREALAEIWMAVHNLPPVDWRDRVASIERLATANNAELIRIRTLMESRE